MSERCSTVVEQLSRLNPFAGAEGLAEVPRPDESSIPRCLPPVEQIPHIQKLLDTLSYNHLPRTIFNLEKHRSLQSVLMTAKEILTEALPIRCLEATFVALLLTQGMKDVDRIPLSFKSQANGSTYRHIVLAIRARTPSRVCYGALGLSRKSTLMFKPMTFNSLYDLVMDYHRQYALLGHELVDIKLGVAISHDPFCRFYPCWRYVALRLSDYLSTPAPTLPHIGVAESTKNIKETSAASPHMRSHEPFGDAADEESPFSPTKLESPITTTGTADEESSPTGPERSSNGVVSSTMQSDRELPSCENGMTCFDDPTAGRRAWANALEAFLHQYTRLLSAITEQLNKGIQGADGASQATRLCYLDLDLAERDVAAENRRRLDLIARGQSPLSPEARRAAANRSLRSTTKSNGRSASRRAGAAASRTGGVSGPPIKRRPGPARTNTSGAAGRKGPPGGTKRGSPSSKGAVTTADTISEALKGELLSPNTPSYTHHTTAFPHAPGNAHQNADLDEIRSHDSSHSEHILSRHDSADSAIFSSLGGSEKGSD